MTHRNGTHIQYEQARPANIHPNRPKLVLSRSPRRTVGPLPIKSTANQNEDHNWRRKEGKQYRGEVAISKGNRPEPRAERKNDEYINKQQTLII